MSIYKDSGPISTNHSHRIPKPTPKRGAKWIESHLDDSGIKPIKNAGNGTTKVWFVCRKGHQFKMGGYQLVGGYNLNRKPSCPVCNPEQFTEWEHERHIELSSA